MAADIVHQGTLHKLGGNVKSWTKRWMILKKDNVLYYYKDPNKSPQGSIPLTDHMFLAKEGRERDLNWPKVVGIERTIVIRTSYRIYYMYADTQPEAAEWVERLQKAAESIPGKKVAKRFVPKSTEVPDHGKSRSKTSSVSSNLSASIDTVESLYDAAKQPDSDCSISTDEENGQGPDSTYAVPPSSEVAENDAIYESTDDDPSQSRTFSSSSLTSPAPLLPAHGISKSSSPGNQPIYEDADTAPDTNAPDEVYEVVNDQQPAWAASRHLPPSDPPPPPPDDDDDDDEDTVPLPQPAIPPKNSELPPPIPTRGSAAKLINSGDDSPPAVPLRKTAASSPKTNGNYSVLDKIEKPPMSTSPPALIQKSRIDSPVPGTISPTEIESLKYEPEEDSEEFYVDMAVNDETANKDRLKLESQRQKELEAQRQKELEAQRQKEQQRLEEERQWELEEQRQREHEAQRQRQQEAEAELQRQREMKLKQRESDSAIDKTKRLSQVELEAQQQAEYEARMQKEMEDKKKERLDYLANKSKSTPNQLAVNGANDAKKKRSGTNMFKAQRNRLVESVDTDKETSSGKPNTAAWLAIERERTLMQEEKLKLEQEKRRLEEERENFEREKRRMQMEMARLKQ